MQWFSVLLLVICISKLSFSQNNINGTHYTHFNIELEEDTVDFVVADTNLTVQKPLFLFLQGSQPVPLFVDFGNGGVYPLPLNNFDLKEMKKHYHVVVISMPKTPVLVTPKNLNNQYCYVSDTSDQRSYLTEYLKADVLDNYVFRANQVINYLRDQKWVDNSVLTVAGHSQGARVAVALAASNEHITKLGLFGYNPQRRINQLVRAQRKEAQEGKITWEEADSIQQNYYDFYREINNDDSLRVKPYLNSWRSFSVSSMEQLTELEIPVYIAYGSEDIIAENNDLLPLEFIEKGKENYYIRRYPNLEHNFFPVKEGTVDHKNGQWSSVMNSFVMWSLE